MDPRRLLITALCSLALAGCALIHPPRSAVLLSVGAAPPADAVEDISPDTPLLASPPEVADVTAAILVQPDSAQPYHRQREVPARAPASEAPGPLAIAAANRAARATSSSDGFVGGIQVFHWSPGRVFEVWTAPLRVTTLSLAPGEVLVAKAAGDTVRWQIGEVISGVGAAAQTHVLLKPLQRDLETNLVLTTNRRVYLIQLKSGSPDSFNAAVAWEAGAVLASAATDGDAQIAAIQPDPVVMPRGPLDGRYRIEPQGRRARWTPTSVFNDGLRTFITFNPDIQVDEAPALFVIAPDGERQLVNYRQVGGLYVVDRVFDRAELRLGDRRPQVVVIRRLVGASS